MIRAGIVLASTLVMASAASAHDAHLVAALQPTFSIASALTEGTNIEVRAAPVSLPGMGGLDRALKRPDAQTIFNLQAADAVVTIRGVWPADPLYPQARDRNIRVVELDATRALGSSHASVALIEPPDVTAPWRDETAKSGEASYVWLSPTNGIRMAEILAVDLKRLAPKEEANISANLARFTGEMQALQSEYEDRLLGVAEPRLFALSDRFTYLTNAFGLFVEGYFTEPDVRWTEADYDGFKATLKSLGITHVLHHWEPDPKVAAAIAEAGAELVILDDAQQGKADATAPDPKGYQRALRADLETLLDALEE